MNCPSCKAEIPDGSKFCIHCGASLPLICAACRHGNPPHAKFCGRCGALLVAVSPSPPASSAERRQLTVMFCDLVGSTALSVRLDPEDLREVIVAYQKYVAETVARFGGFVAKYMGDAVLAYFGYPRAQEHDAERAVRAALAVRGGLYERDWPSDVAPQVRIGIATGLVVVGGLVGGEGAAQEHEVIGETPNLAARLQEFAKPNTVVIEANTRRLTGGLFDYRDLGSVALKGFAKPSQAIEVIGLGATDSRFEALHEAGVLPLMGRDAELALLLQCWNEAKGGEGRVVLLSGEAGIGKSRLAAALHEAIAIGPHRRLRYFCSPHHTDSALHPVIAQFARAASFEREDDPAARLDKLQALLARGSASTEDAALIAELLSLADIDRRYPRLDLAPQQRKQRTLEAIWRQIEALAHRRPILMIVEDAQWIDPTSLELLDYAVREAPRSPVMILVTFRPDFVAPWVGQAQVRRLALNRLAKHAVRALVEHVEGSEALSQEMIGEIVERTDGVPLFIEELTKAVVEAGPSEAGVLADIPAAQYHIPATLHASLTNRLDRLGPAKELAQVGAVIGRRFAYDLLAAVADRDEAELGAMLDQLTAAGLVFRQGTPPQATYLFKHALVQDVAYGSLLRSTRQLLHARIAAALEAEFPETAPELLAQHWAQAADGERAVRHWHKAGKQAIQRGANREAIAQLTKGLRTLEQSPDRIERDRTELGLQLLLAEALMADKGWTALEMRPCYARVRVLCERTGDTEALFPVLYGQFSHHLSRGEADAAHSLALETRQLTEGSRDPALLAMGHCMLAMSLFSRGELAAARSHLETALSIDQPESHSHTFLAPGHNFAIASMWLGLTLLLLGYPEQASRRISSGIEAARNLANPHTLSHALALACRYNSVRGDIEALHGVVEELARVAAEHEFPFYVAAATIYRGWVLSARGDERQGIAVLREGMTAFVDVGASALRPYVWGKIAVLAAAEGSLRDGLDLVDDGLAQVNETGQRWCEAELYRQKGELLAGVPDATGAEHCLRQGLAVARRQDAKLWELRAACSLGRLWRDQGRTGDARALLAPLYGWFGEGFETPDLTEAKALLGELDG